MRAKGGRNVSVEDSFVPTRTRWLTVAVLPDFYSQRVVGWAMSPRQTLSVVVEAWWMAWQRRHPTKKELVRHRQFQNQAESRWRLWVISIGSIPAGLVSGARLSGPEEFERQERGA